MRVVNLRAKQQSGKLSALLESAGLTELCIPALEVTPADNLREVCKDIEPLLDKSLCVFTSQNAIHALNEHLPLQGLRSVAIGKKTRSLLETEGAEVVFCPTSANSDTLAAELLEFMQEKDDRLLLLRGSSASDTLARALAGCGIPFSNITVYDSVCPEHAISELKNYAASLGLSPDAPAAGGTNSGKVVIAATSGLAIKNLQTMFTRISAQLTPDWLHLLHEIPAFCIGPTTAGMAQKLGFSERILAEEATVESLVHKLLEYRDQ